MTFSNSIGTITNVPVQWNAATLNTNTNQYEASIIKAYHSVYLSCYKTWDINELQFRIISQEGTGVTSPSTITSTYPFWVSQQLAFNQDYEYIIFKFFNSTKQLFVLQTVGKTVNATDVSQEFSVFLPASITI